MSSLEEHDQEQSKITAMCESGQCGHPECVAMAGTMHEILTDIYNPGETVGESNDQRAVRALLAFFPSYDDDDLETGIVDILSDLRHLCDLTGLEFHKLNRRAHGLYSEEVNDYGVAKNEAGKEAIKREIM